MTGESGDHLYGHLEKILLYVKLLSSYTIAIPGEMASTCAGAELNALRFPVNSLANPKIFAIFLYIKRPERGDTHAIYIPLCEL